MTVRELIEFLNQCTPGARVMIDGYEGGIKELRNAVITDVLLDYHAGMSYYGPHEVADSTWIEDDERNTFTVESVVYLPR